MTKFPELFLAWRYFKPKRNAVSVITVISVFGVSIGVCVLMVVLAIMTGFTDEITHKIINTRPHIQIQSYSSAYISKPEDLIKKIDELGVQAVARTQGEVLVQSGKNVSPQYLIGIDPYEETDRNYLEKSITEGKYSLNDGDILVSYVLANQMGLHPGSRIIVHSPAKIESMVKIGPDGKVEPNAANKVYLPSEFKVAGIFNVGEYTFDSKVIITDLDDANNLFGYPLGAATLIAIKTKDPFHMNDVLQKIQAICPSDYQISTWMQLNKGLLDVLAVEKNMMFFVLIFIVLVAASSIMNTLITVAVQKTKEIGLMMAIGARGRSIMLIFVLQGFFVGFIGTISGLILGSIVVHWRMPIMFFLSDVFNIELFPRQFYFLSQLPARIVPSDVLFISICSIVLCTLGAMIPAYRAARLDPAKALRYE